MSKSKKKTVGNNIPARPYLNPRGVNGMSEEDIDQLCAELIEWAHKETSIAVRDFYTDLLITRDKWEQWMAKFPKLYETNAWAKLKIASRHEARMLDRRYDANSARFALRMLDSHWQAQHVEDMERKARIANENNHGNITIAGIDFQLPHIRGAEGTD